MPSDRTETAACLTVGVALIIGGSLATGVVPEGAIYQVGAGAVIVAGFAVVFFCIGALEFPE